MRFYGLALLASAAVLGACGGGGDAKKDSAAALPPTNNPPAATTPGAATKMAATGTTHTVKMVGDEKGYKFEPAALTIKTGDAIKFIMVSGGPHNVAFDPATVPPAGKAQLDANMDQKTSELSSPIMMNPNEEYTISFAGVPAGSYPFHCTPHLAMNMKGTITVQ